MNVRTLRDSVSPKVALWLTLSAALVAVALLVSCGDDDCPVCPKPDEEIVPDYHVLYCCEERSSYDIAYTFSLKYGTVVDLAFYNLYDGAFWDATFSEDGSYTYYTRTAFGITEPDSWTWVTDTRTGDTLAICSGKGGYRVEVSSGGNYLLTSESRMLTLYKLPSLDILYEDTSSGGIGNAVFHPFERRFYFDKQPGAYYLFVGNYDSTGVTSVVARPMFNRAGDAVGPVMKSVSPDGKYLILDVGIFMGPKYFQVLDTDSLSIVHETLIPDTRLHFDHAWHPDGKRVFMTFNGGFDNPDIGGIDVYDITTNTLQYYVTSGDISMGTEMLQPGYLSLTPEGDQMVILNGGGPLPSGSVLVLDIAAKLLTKRIDTHKPGYYSYAMALIPIDWEREK
jgi:DNA-binding beta-propeller fold protein YncE